MENYESFIILLLAVLLSVCIILLLIHSCPGIRYPFFFLMYSAENIFVT